MKSINNRRGGGGSGSTSRATSITTLIRLNWWKYLLLAIFVVLVSLSVNLNIRIFDNDNNNDSPAAIVESFNHNMLDNDADDPPTTNTDAGHNKSLFQKQNQQPSNAAAAAQNNMMGNKMIIQSKSGDKKQKQQYQNTNRTAASNNNYPAKERGFNSIQEGELVLRKKYLEHLRGLQPFPKKLHILFPHKDYYKRDPPLPFVKHTILRFMELNPSWNVTVYDDADMDLIIKKAADDGIISVEEKHVLVGNDTAPAAHPVERADLARMLIIWYYGGMYVDADALQNPKDFDKVFQPSIKMCLPIYINVNFAQSIVCSSPNNRLHMEIIKQMSKHRMKSNRGRPIERRGGWATSNALFSMGPPLFNRMVFQIVFGKSHRGIGNIPGIEEDMRVLQREANDVIATGQFIDECNSFIADPYEGCRPRDRAELYGSYNMSSWGMAVKRRWASDS
eukprot:CAMPEP_0201878358 /NCGR_PEP_ID=MMETSP0902-20130614/9532_1 /ASSEMBLY_ACC=CAM_ASM_000551 /TAXON_ID=420261 /ORGANISM="Thalassiosira antarctica, Strain CCMP982" /LENGTH=448 /DNA_ID=CAMNT_0048405985 /DNA_START=98 /DNA_END=1444 /DNA_ORIENTATION=+